MTRIHVEISYVNINLFIFDKLAIFHFIDTTEAISSNFLLQSLLLKFQNFQERFLFSDTKLYHRGKNMLYRSRFSRLLGNSNKFSMAFLGIRKEIF